MTDRLPEALAAALDRVERRRRRLALARALGGAALVLGTAAAGGAAADRWLAPEGQARAVAGAIAWGGGLAVLLAGGGLAAWRRAGRAESARLAERALGRQGDAPWSSAVALAGNPGQGTAPWMVARCLALAGTSAAAIDPRRCLDGRPAARWLAAGTAVVLLGAGACAWELPRGHLLRVLLPWADLPRPSLLHLMVEGGAALVPAGAPWAVAATVQGGDPATPVRLRLAWQDGGSQELELRQQGTRHYLQLPAVRQGFRWRLLAGDAATVESAVAVVAAPRVAGLRLRIQPPEYAGLPAREADGDAELLAGSTVAVTVAFDGRPDAAALVWEGGEAPLRIAGDSGSASLVPAATLAFGVRVVARAGGRAFAATGAERVLLSVRPDLPPEARLALPPRAAAVVAPDEAVRLEALALDDVGLRAASVRWGAGGRSAERVLAVAGRRSAGLAALLPAELEAGPGTTIEARLAVSDLAGHETLSAPLRVQVAAAGEAGAARLVAAADRAAEVLARVAADARRLEALWARLAAASVSERAQADGEGESARLAAERLAAAAGAACAELRREVAAADAAGAACAPAGARIAAHLAAWAQGLDGGAADPAAAQAGHAAGAQRAQEGAALLRLLAAAAAADGLAARSGAQRARSARSAVLVEADRAWRGGLGGARPGLLARFYRGPEPAGTPVRSDTTPPVVHADPPDLGVPWSACWQGEIELPAAGEWTFAATADDAVALAVDGQELLPAGAWTRQAPTEYRGSRQLAAGWHRLELRYNQTGGGMFLEAQAGRGGALRPLTAYPLRHRPGAGGTGTAELVAAMASLPPVDLAAIEGELAAALAGAGDSASAAAELVSGRALPEDPALPDDLAAAARRCRPKGAPAAWDLATVLDGAAAAADAAGRIDGLATRCRQRLDQALAALPGEGPTARLEHLLAAKAPAAELRAEQAAVAQRWRAQPASPEQRLALLAAAAALDGARQEHELHAAIDRARQQVRRATLDGVRADALALAAARPAGAAEEEAARTAALAIARTLERAGLAGEARDLRAAADAAARAERARALGQPAGPPPAIQAAELLDARAAALDAAGTAPGQQALAAQELAAVQAALRAADPALAALQQRAAQAADDGAARRALAQELRAVAHALRRDGERRREAALGEAGRLAARLEDGDPARRAEALRALAAADPAGTTAAAAELETALAQTAAARAALAAAAGQAGTALAPLAEGERRELAAGLAALTAAGLSDREAAGSGSALATALAERGAAPLARALAAGDAAAAAPGRRLAEAAGRLGEAAGRLGEAAAALAAADRQRLQTRARAAQALGLGDAAVPAAMAGNPADADLVRHMRAAATGATAGTPAQARAAALARAGAPAAAAAALRQGDAAAVGGGPGPAPAPGPGVAGAIPATATPGTAEAAAWSRLRGDRQDPPGTAAVERFDGDEQTAIRAYLRRLAEGR